jgi:hypothetical protein
VEDVVQSPVALCQKIKCHVDGTLVAHFALATLVYRSKITAPLNASKGVQESRIRNRNCDCNAEDASSCQEIKVDYKKFRERAPHSGL